MMRADGFRGTRRSGRSSSTANGPAGQARRLNRSIRPTARLRPSLRKPSRPDVDSAVQAARLALERPSWRDLKPHERARLLARFADAIDQDRDGLAGAQMQRQRQDRGRVPVAGGRRRRRRALLRGRLRDVRRRHHAGARRLPEPLDPRADRRGRRHHAVELAADARGAEVRADSGGRQRAHPEVVGNHPAGVACATPSSPRAPVFRPASSTCSPASAVRWAKRSFVIPAST